MSIPEQDLQLGHHGQDVTAWQRTLHTLGFDPGALDGVFGPVTSRATRAFQSRHGLTPDGVVGLRSHAAARDAVPTQRLPHHDQPGSRALGLAFVEVARRELALGAREIPIGSNDGDFVRKYFAGTSASPPAAWCAAFLRFCLTRAARTIGVASPITGSVSAKAWMHQLQEAHRWLDVDELRADPTRLRSGMVVVWDRGDWRGHVGVVSVSPATGTFLAIEGNTTRPSAPAALDELDTETFLDQDPAAFTAEKHHTLVEISLLGAGWID